MSHEKTIGALYGDGSGKDEAGIPSTGFLSKLFPLVASGGGSSFDRPAPRYTTGRVGGVSISDATEEVQDLSLTNPIDRPAPPLKLDLITSFPLPGTFVVHEPAPSSNVWNLTVRLSSPIAGYRRFLLSKVVMYGIPVVAGVPTTPVHVFYFSGLPFNVLTSSNRHHALELPTISESTNYDFTRGLVLYDSPKPGGAPAIQNFTIQVYDTASPPVMLSNTNMSRLLMIFQVE